MSVNRRRADRGAKPLLHVGVRQDPLSWNETLYQLSYTPETLSAAEA